MQEETIFKELNTLQEKYAFTLMAGAGAAIAYALNLTHGQPLAKSHLILGVAVVCWAGSFYCGCQQTAYRGSTMYANGQLLRVQNGTHPDGGINPNMMAIATNGIKQALEFNSTRAGVYMNAQFRLFITGGVFF